MLPAIVIVIILAKLYFKCRSSKIFQGILKGLHHGVVAMVLSATVTLGCNAFWGGKSLISIPNTNILAIIIACLVAVLLQKKKIGPIQGILLSGVVGALIYAVV